jgi:hypothetical protein
MMASSSTRPDAAAPQDAQSLKNVALSYTIAAMKQLTRPSETV